jgi:hypothetical protein
MAAECSDLVGSSKLGWRGSGANAEQSTSARKRHVCHRSVWRADRVCGVGHAAREEGVRERARKASSFTQPRLASSLFAVDRVVWGGAHLLNLRAQETNAKGKEKVIIATLFITKRAPTQAATRHSCGCIPPRRSSTGPCSCS